MHIQYVYSSRLSACIREKCRTGHRCSGGSSARTQKWYDTGAPGAPAQVQLVRLGTAVRMISRDLTKYVTTAKLGQFYKSCNLRDTSLFEVQQWLRKKLKPPGEL